MIAVESISIAERVKWVCDSVAATLHAQKRITPSYKVCGKAIRTSAEVHFAQLASNYEALNWEKVPDEEKQECEKIIQAAAAKFDEEIGAQAE